MKFFFLLIILLLSFTYSFGQNLMLDYLVQYKEVSYSSTPMFDIKSVFDSNGNQYTTAEFSGSIDIDPGPDVYNLTMEVMATNSIFLQKLSPSGEFIWGISFGGPDNNWIMDIIIDNEGNIILTGAMEGQPGTYDILDGPNEYNVTLTGAESDAIIMKISPEGQVLWAKTFGSWGREYGEEVAISPNNNIVVAGYYKNLDSMDIDPGPGVFEIPNSGANEQIFIIELDPDGNFINGGYLKSSGGSSVTGIMFSEEGYLTLCGKSDGTLDIDPGPEVITVGGMYAKNALLVQLDHELNHRWHYLLDGPGTKEFYAINKDSNGNIYAIGIFAGTVYFQPNEPTVANSNTVFLVKLDSNGNYLDHKVFWGTSTYYFLNSLAIDSSQNLLFNIFFRSTLDVDPGPGIINITTHDPEVGESCIIKLNQNLDLVWYQHFEGRGEFMNIEVNSDGGLLLSGYIEDSLVIDPTGANTLYHINGGGFISKFHEYQCGNMTLIPQEINSVQCDSVGIISLNTLNGYPPLTYQWAHLEDSSTSSITIDSAGVYSVEVTDYLGCQRGVTYVVSGPENLTGFDLNANLVGGSFRTGFPTTIQIDAFNNGCTPVSGSLILTLDSLVSIDSVSIAPISIENNQLIWDLATSNMDSDHFTPKIYLTVSTSAQIGDSINLQLLITPEQNDLDTTNNSKTYSFPVINGYDPNDIRINPVKKCDVNYLFLDEVHTYTIRFQNTGNAEAVNIVVIDSLSSSLDFSTFKLLGKSFDKMYISLEENNVVKFHMDSIMLLDSTTNESLSHGYIIYEISPLNSVSENTIISNKAEIYFDFNPAVITNTVSTLLVSEMNCDLNVNSIENDDNLLIYPNPVSDMLTIKISPALLSKPYSIVDQYGREISSGFFTSMEHTINLSTFSTGLYFINVEGNNKHAKIFKY